MAPYPHPHGGLSRAPGVGMGSQTTVRMSLPTVLGLGMLAAILVLLLQRLHADSTNTLRFSQRELSRLDAEPFASGSVASSALHNAGEADKDSARKVAAADAEAALNMKAISSSSSSSSSSSQRRSSEDGPKKKTVHFVVTSNGNRYMNWQTRVLYRSFLRQAVAENSALAAFTRILHRTSDDELMQEIPTLRFDPLQPDCDVWCSYPVADRADAIARWLETDDAKRHEYVLVGETDYLFMKPLTVSSLPPATSMGFPFGYIVPAHESVRDVVRRHVDDKYRLEDVPQTGNAPQLLRTSDLAKVVPLWVQKTRDIDLDDAAREKLGWVREMYAYSIASAEAGLSHDLLVPPRNRLMVQPPADEALGDACFAHYTWGGFLHVDGKKVWGWDKREYGNGQYGDEPARMVEIPAMPPYDAKFTTQDNVPWTRAKYELYEEFTRHFNLAVRDVNAVNNGIPTGFATWQEAAQAARPSERAKLARMRVEEAERAKAGR